MIVTRLFAAAALIAIPTLASAQAVPTPTYLMKAGASDLFERQSAAVMTGSTKPAIRSFAAMMAKDHAKSTAEVKAAAMRAHLHVSPPMLSREQASNLTALKQAHGSARDQLYVSQQKTAHQDALALQQGYASDGKVASLRMAAGKIVPVVQHHIAMLDAM